MEGEKRTDRPDSLERKQGTKMKIDAQPTEEEAAQGKNKKRNRSQSREKINMKTKKYASEKT